jgi:hypothetical protein
VRSFPLTIGEAQCAARAEGLLNDALDPDGFASFAVSATEGAIAQSERFVTSRI